MFINYNRYKRKIKYIEYGNGCFRIKPAYLLNIITQIHFVFNIKKNYF